MGDAVKITVERSDGATIPFGCGTGWAILSDGLEEFGLVSQDVSTSANVLTDGSSLVSKRVPEIDRTISAVYTGKNADAARAEMLSFLNPKHSFKVHVTYRGRTRWFEGELIKSEVSVGNVNAKPTVTFTLLCPNPYMKSEDGNFNSLTDAKPMFGFPFVSHARRQLPNGEKHPVGFNASILLYDGLNTVYNSGDVETTYIIRCECGGTVTNPVFEKDGRFVKLVSTFQAGDLILIDFTKAPPSVTVNGQNAIQMCSRDSNFTGMQMQVGANVFTYSCDNAENRPLMDVQVNFYKQYLGV